MNMRPNPPRHLSIRTLLAPATIALLVTCALISTPQALATGKPKPKQGTTHTQKQGSAHSQIILQHHGHAKGAHSDIILQHHHR